VKPQRFEPRVVVIFLDECEILCIVEVYCENDGMHC